MSPVHSVRPVSRPDEWEAAALDLDAYLERIGYDGPREPTVATLRGLHLAHVASIVFENVDALLGPGVSLDLACLQDKLVRQCRGGYCHEHNLLFAAVLERLGFRVTRLLARARDDGQTVLPRGHATLLVAVDDRLWLADVGFGSEGLLEPVPLVEGAEVHQGPWAYGLERRGADWILRGDGTVLYSFAPGEYRRPDFEAANYFVSTHTSSPFATELIVQRAHPHARYALRGLDLTITIGGGGQARRQIAARDLRDVLRDTFEVSVTPAQAVLLAATARGRSQRAL